MTTQQMKREIDTMAREMPLWVVTTQAEAEARRLRVAALRYCGMAEGAKTFECNECGQVHPFESAVAVNRGDSANLVCRECQQCHEFETL